MIRLLLVDNTSSLKPWLQKSITESTDLEVVGRALDHKQACILTEELKPDVILIDMSLPKMGGLNATEEIMASCPTPIVVLSNAADETKKAEVMRALQSGALDVLESPEDKNLTLWTMRFLETIRAASRVKVLFHSKPKNTESKKENSPAGIELVAIGASAGGPLTVSHILKDLAPLHVPVIVTIHFPEDLNKNLIDWYTNIAHMPVVEATDGSSLDNLKGKICLAKPGVHLATTKRYLEFKDEAPRHFCKPSIDILFESIAKSHGSRALGVLLTGMGRDGAEGLLKLRRAGGRTLAQDETTSVVFGMPKAAIELGAAEKVIPSDEMANTISKIVNEDSLKKSQ